MHFLRTTLHVAFCSSLLHLLSAAASVTTLHSFSSTLSTPSDVMTSTISYNPSLPQKTPLLPLNGGATELPAPTLPLKFITIGRGTQNYSCSAIGAVPVAEGAIATLYDLSRLAKKNETALHEVPPNIVSQPLSTVNSGYDLYIPHHGIFSKIGKHFFSGEGVPIFDLSAKQDILFGIKIASIPAPASANAGPAGTGAVPWLELRNKGGSIGVLEAYRVVTAGGKAPAVCLDTNSIIVQYAAEYWFFG